MKALLWRCFFHVHFWEVLHEINEYIWFWSGEGLSQYGITAMVSIHSISDDGNKEAVKEAVNEFVLRIMDDCETMGYSEERRA